MPIEKLTIVNSNDTLSYFLNCPIGEPTPNITWTKDSNEIVRDNGEVKIRKWAMVLEDLIVKDTGNYTCKVCNTHGCIEHSTHLQVVGK